MNVKRKINPLDDDTRYVMFDAINQRHFNGTLPRPEISIENLDDRYGDIVAMFCITRFGRFIPPIATKNWSGQQQSGTI